jgi:AcrR family transcriptional regulator
MMDPTVKPTEPERRPYRSPKREQAALATRRAIRAAAEQLFLRDGYARTSMKAIAARAGVSERTVYLAFPRKAVLLSEIIRVAVRGDDAPVALADRADWRAMLAAPGPELLGRFAALTAALMTRTARVLALGEAAAAADPELARERDRGHAATRTDLRQVATALAERGVLRAGLDEQAAADILFALAADESIYLRLTDACHWSESQYAQVLEDALRGALGEPPTRSSRGRRAARARPR